MEWYTDLCEYYNVSPEEALKLGTRSSGRKPSLPSSPTTHAVSNMTMEDIWESSERKTIDEVFNFYKDQGAWSTFRQCVRHKDLKNLHMSIFQNLIGLGALFNGAHISEYGCGVAPFLTSLLENLDPANSPALTLTLTDVESEHFTFAQYRLPKILKRKGLENIKLNFEKITSDSLPSFSSGKLNALLCFEVLEHVPSPTAALRNIQSHMSPGAIYVENFVKHEASEDDDDDGPDLLSARKERPLYYEILNKEFELLHPSHEASTMNPNCTRIWRNRGTTA